jgi:hypothetical protein
MKTSNLIVIWFFSLLGLGLLIKLIIDYLILKNIGNNLNKIYPISIEVKK